MKYNKSKKCMDLNKQKDDYSAPEFRLKGSPTVNRVNFFAILRLLLSQNKGITIAGI